MKTGYALRRPVVNAYLVRERDRRRWRELSLVLLVVLPLGLALWGYTWTRLEALRAGYRIHSLERDLRDLEDQLSKLELLASRLSSPALLEQRAREELGLEPPTLEQMVFVEARQ